MEAVVFPRQSKPFPSAHFRAFFLVPVLQARHCCLMARVCKGREEPLGAPDWVGRGGAVLLKGIPHGARLYSSQLRENKATALPKNITAAEEHFFANCLCLCVVERLQEEKDQLLKENTQVKEEKGQLQAQLERLQEEKDRLLKEHEFLKIQRHKVDVSLDADTAHPRLAVSQDGKRVSDTGTAIKVPRTEKRFDSHTFLLAKEGYTSGKYYWEVDVGKRRNWDVGIAREPVTRKGTLTVSPEKGFWVIGLADGQDYWARTEPWTRLVVSGKPRKIGIFLDVSAKKLSFFNVSKKTAVYTFTLGGDSSQEGKFFPFFSTGSPSAKPDTEPLKIVLGFEEDPDDE